MGIFMVFCKKTVLKNFVKFTEDTCARVSYLIKLFTTFLWRRYFPVNFAKFLRTPFL